MTNNTKAFLICMVAAVFGAIGIGTFEASAPFLAAGLVLAGIDT